LSSANNKLKDIKNKAKIISKYKVFIYLENIPPSITNIVEGIPIVNRNFLSNPFSNNGILLR
jgi:hypothetical protein